MAEQNPAGVYTGGISRRDINESDARTLQRLKNRLYIESKDLNFKGRLNRYYQKYATKFKIVDGKKVRWDTRLDRPFDPKNAIKFANLNAYQTTTPRKDVKYLEASEALRIRRAQGVDPISKFFSKKLVEGSEYGTVAEAELAAKLAEREKVVDKLRIGSSYETPPDAGDAMDGGGSLPNITSLTINGNGDTSEETPKEVSNNQTLRIKPEENLTSTTTSGDYRYNRFTKEGLDEAYEKFEELTGKRPSRIQEQLIQGGWSPQELHQKKIDYEKRKKNRRRK
tara:strand:+ start:40 stop:885 length:846 start_codon:yes stop_codon:yes gene_type:complete